MRFADRPEKGSRDPSTYLDCIRPAGLPRYRRWQIAELVAAVAESALELAAAVVRWECNRCQSAPALTLSPGDGE